MCEEDIVVVTLLVKDAIVAWSPSELCGIYDSGVTSPTRQPIVRQRQAR